MRRAIVMAIIATLAGIARAQHDVARTDAPSAEPPTKADPAAALAASMPHIRIDRENTTIEFDGFVPVDAHIEGAPNLYLEVMVSTPDVRAHEAVVASRASAADIHAALLLIGLEPGATGSWTWNGERVTTNPPTGPGVEVRFRWKDERGESHDDLASDWVVSAVTGARLTDSVAANEPRWVFAGSKMVARNGREWYAAEAEGTIVGLHTFGSETIAWRGVYSPSAEVQDPEWIADPARVPRAKAEVVVVIRAIDGRAGDK